MRYRGIIEITPKPAFPSTYSESLYQLLSEIDGSIKVIAGRVVEIEFEADALGAADKLEAFAQKLVTKETEQYAYRLQWIGEQGFGETTLRYSEGPPRGVMAETPMRYVVDDPVLDLKGIDLTDKFPPIGMYRLIRAEWITKHPRYASIRVEKDGDLLTHVTRIDLKTGQLMDAFPDTENDSVFQGMVENVWPTDKLWGVIVEGIKTIVSPG